MNTAVLIDGGYFLKRFPACYPQKNKHDAAIVAKAAFQLAVAHLTEKIGRGERAVSIRHQLHRIFFYDCPPIVKKAHLPVSRNSIDFGKSDVARFRISLHEEMRSLRKTALRLGHMSDDAEWTLNDGRLKEVLSGRKQFADLVDADFHYSARQKGVDMRIGLDIASLAYKRQVSQIVLVAGDSDFVPAAKLARREGIDFVLDPMWRDVHSSLNEHVDGIRSTCPRPGLPATEAELAVPDDDKQQEEQR